MACFPRFFRTTSKNSFTPAVDENADTVLNNADNPVQIGRYIRREETPVFTPKSSNLLIQIKPKQTQKEQPNDQLQQQQQQQVPNLKRAANSYNNNNSNSKIKADGNIGSNNNTNSFSKKFISNNNKYNNNNYNNNNLSSTFNQNTPTNTKLKPVKERRPTALPFEQPIVTETENESNNQINGNNEDDGELLDDYSDLGSYPQTPNTPSTHNVQFFIGGRGDDIDAASGSVLMGFENLSIRTNSIGGFGEQRTPSSLSQTTSKSQHLPSITIDAITQQNVRIPTPPPMPPQLLTSAASTTSMASIRSANAKRHTNAIKELNGGYLESDLNSLLETQLEWMTFDKASMSTPKDSDVSDSPASHRVEGGLIYTRANLPISKKDIEIPYIRKDEPTRDLIRAAILKNDFLHNYMDKERTEMVIDAMALEYYDKDAFIIRENDEGSEIYVSEDGYFDVIKNEKVVGTFGPATVFGELAILYNAKRFASVQAVTYARVWKIDRDTFRHIMILSGSRERQEKLNFLKSAPFLKDLTEEVLDKVADLLQRKFYETNTCIVREGEVGNEFFIIRGGSVTIKKKDKKGVECIVARRQRGDYFGEQALVNADRRQASVYADPPGTEVLKLDREAFNSYLGTIPQLREKPDSSDLEIGRDNNRKSEFYNEYAHIELTELKKIATLGAGAFGRVDLVAYNEKIFALKIIKKIDIVKQDQIEHVYSEKHVMMKCSKSPFIIELYKTYRNEKFVYFLMEACMGGDVWTVMSQRRFFDEKTARFIAGCVVEAFDFLHSHNIIYRDLKPENLMLTTDGYCKLVDFGFAKHIPPYQKTNTFAGTPEYVAPEIILDRGHDRAVDYWALGILIYELLVGKTPFREQNQIKIYQKILGGIDVIQMPSKIPKSAQNLIKHLCKQLPAERLGYQRKGIQDIKKHGWFDSLDWQKLKNKQLSSPIKRPITSNTDTQYFGSAGVDNDHDPPDETSGWDKDF